MPSSVAEPRAPRSPEDLLAEVHRRAGRHRRRTRLVGGTAVVAFALVAGLVPLALHHDEQNSTGRSGGDVIVTAPPAPVPPGPPGPPATFLSTGIASNPPPGSGPEAVALNVMATDGSGPIRSFPVQPGGLARAEPPAWPEDVRLSPDGRMAYYRWADASGCREIRRLDLREGVIMTAVGPTKGQGIMSFALGPDGRPTALAVARSGCEGRDRQPVDIVVEDPATGGTRVVFTYTPIYAPALSVGDDGGQVAFALSTGQVDDVVIHLADARSGEVTTVPTPAGCRYLDPDFVPGTGLLLATEDCWVPPPDWDGLDEREQALRWSGRPRRGTRLVLVEPSTGRIVRTVFTNVTEMAVRWIRLDASGRYALLYALDNTGPRLLRLSLDDGTTEAIPVPPQPPQPPTASLSSELRGAW